MIELYSHNQTAYNRAVAMLASRSKAVVIHPTGTGKSFVAFKLAEYNPSSRILRLLPSEYIYRTQLENVKNVSSFVLRNITFMTYAKLMQTDMQEICALTPSYIITYEFHCAGAQI